MTVDAHDRPMPDPDDIAAQSFSKVRKGFEVDEVRAYLVALAAQVREAQQTHADASRRLTELERRVTDPRDLDEAQVTQLLGEETARVLETARQAAAEIRIKADEYAATTRGAADTEVAELRATTSADVDAMRSAAESVLAERTAEAEAVAAAIRAEADGYAAETRAAADRDAEALRAEAKEQGRAMVEEARTYRERVIADLADRRRLARTQLEELAASRDALAVALTDVAGRIEASHRSLADAVVDPRTLGDVATDRAALADEDDFEPVEPEPEPVEPEPEPEPEPEVQVEAGDDEDPAAALFAQLKAETADETEAEAGETQAEADVTVEDAEPETAATADEALLERRDAATDELERQLARRLKRVLSDEQNEALDRLRRSKGTPDAEEVLLAEGEHLGRYHAAALEDLVAAERSGASFFGEAPRRHADVSDVAEEFASELVRQLRGRLEAAFEDGGDEAEISERIRACYREWKTQRIAETAAHYVLVSFNRGVAEAAAEGDAARWLVDDGPTPCPDCDDNALAGAVPKGEPFPTGDLHPPAHPGCRCLAVPT